MPDHLLIKYLEEVGKDSLYSPDIHELQSQYEYVPVFVYGQEKARYSNNKILGSSPRVGVGFTAQNTYVMHVSEEGMPVVLRNAMLSYPARIHGDIFLVPTSLLFELDVYFENTIAFNRKLETIRYTLAEHKDQKDKAWFMSQAWMYLGDYAFWHSKLSTTAFRRLEVIIPKDSSQKSYYYYKQSDDFLKYRKNRP